MSRPFSSFALLLAVTACSNPTVSVNTIDDRPKLQFVNARPTETLILDGISVGPASVYDGEHKTLVVDAGTHEVEVRDGSRTIFLGSIYFGGGASRTINLPD
jgi:hypothetical protein